MCGILKKYFANMYNSNRMGHAFLICNSNYDNLKEELSDILSDYFFNGKKINIEDNPDIYIIKPEKDKILKESIISLQESFKLKSQINENRVYIIDEVHYMNDFSANALLKFLEEPEKNIYAFLLTRNLSKVLPTIKSRCQVLMASSDYEVDFSIFEREDINTAISFVKCFETHKEKAITYIYDFIPKKLDKQNIKNMISIIKYFYRDCLSFLLSKDLCYVKDFVDDINIISSKNTIDTIVNKLIVLNKCENMLEYNLNLNLFLDKLIIEMGM